LKKKGAQSTWSEQEKVLRACFHKGGWWAPVTRRCVRHGHVRINPKIANTEATAASIEEAKKARRSFVCLRCDPILLLRVVWLGPRQQPSKCKTRVKFSISHSGTLPMGVGGTIFSQIRFGKVFFASQRSRRGALVLRRMIKYVGPLRLGAAATPRGVTPVLRQQSADRSRQAQIRPHFFFFWYMATKSTLFPQRAQRHREE